MTAEVLQDIYQGVPAYLVRGLRKLQLTRAIRSETHESYDMKT